MREVLPSEANAYSFEVQTLCPELIEDPLTPQLYRVFSCSPAYCANICYSNLHSCERTEKLEELTQEGHSWGLVLGDCL